MQISLTSQNNFYIANSNKALAQRQGNGPYVVNFSILESFIKSHITNNEELGQALKLFTQINEKSADQDSELTRVSGIFYRDKNENVSNRELNIRVTTHQITSNGMFDDVCEWVLNPQEGAQAILNELQRIESKLNEFYVQSSTN
jgi:hypothetical protein